MSFVILNATNFTKKISRRIREEKKNKAKSTLYIYAHNTGRISGYYNDSGGGGV